VSPREDKRQAILDAALELFVERGFHGTAVPEVAHKAGVGAGTIYRYFDNKEALVNELYRHAKGKMAGCVLEKFPAGAPAREAFRWFWTQMATFAVDNPKAFAFLELHQHSSYFDDDSRAVEEQLFQFALEFIRGAQARKEVREADPMVLMSIVLGSFVGLVRLGWEGKLELTEAKLAEAEQCVWEAIRS
jgi:TetR/AcrR family transcriptional regulator, repressor of fatR-cypB operon